MAKLTTDYVKEQFAKRGWQMLDDIYVKSQHNINVICSNGHSTTITWNNFQRGQGCRFCAGNIKFSIEEARKIFEENGLLLVEKIYKTNNTPMQFICLCGKKSKICLSAVKYGARCQECTNKKIAQSNKLSDEELKIRCENKNFKFVKSFIGKHNRRTYIEYICHCGNQTKTGIYNFNKISNCKLCGIKKKSGSSCYRWKSDREDVRNRKIIRKRISNMISRCLIRSNIEKTSKLIKILKYHPSKLKDKIMSQVVEKELQNKKWHIDHIFPIQAFIDHGIYDLSLINHLDNLQALSEEENLSKSDKYDKEKFLNWLHEKTKTETIEDFLKSNLVEFKFTSCFETEHVNIHYVDITKTSQKVNEQKNKIMKEKHSIFVFSDEWSSRKEQVKNFLKSVLHLNTEKINARKCIVKEIDLDIGRKFCEENHIQGSNKLGHIFFGLFYCDKLVGVLSLGRHSRQRKDLLLDRMCFASNVTIRGGAAKLFKQAIIWARKQGYDKILSFSDKRWSDGNVYKKLNFRNETTLYPDYSYVNITHPHFRLTKQSQKKKTVNCPESMTEKEFARSKGLKLIYDCGKDRWIYDISK